jgi:hypothetical protein
MKSADRGVSDMCAHPADHDVAAANKAAGFVVNLQVRHDRPVKLPDAPNPASRMTQAHRASPRSTVPPAIL